MGARTIVLAVFAAHVCGASAVPLPQDSDNDGLSDAEEAALGTSPAESDTDRDGLPDGWEVNGVPALLRGGPVLDLKALGASPVHADVFVWMDYMIRPATLIEGAVNFYPSDDVLNGIRASFAAGDVKNPDGIDGINVHLLRGNEVPHVAAIEFGAGNDWTEFNRIRTKLTPQQLRCFHQMIWADQYKLNGSVSGSSGRAEINGQFFIVTFGDPGWNPLRPEDLVGTFVHEIGHNFGLRHGSDENVNYKPNHLSVMNYTYQLDGIASVSGGVSFDYQRWALGALDEANLNEQAGLGAASELARVSIRYNEQAWPLGQPIDWNRDGSIDTAPVRADINPDPDPGYQEQIGVLKAAGNEWARLNFTGGAIGSALNPFSCAVIPTCKLVVVPREPLPDDLERELSPTMLRRVRGGQ